MSRFNFIPVVFCAAFATASLACTHATSTSGSGASADVIGIGPFTTSMDGTTTTVSVNGQTIVTWTDTKDVLPQPQYILLTDTNGEARAYRPDGSTIVDWFKTNMVFPQETYILLTDTDGLAQAYNLDGSVIQLAGTYPQWSDTANAFAEHDFFVLTDTHGVAQAFRASGASIAEFGNTQTVLTRADAVAFLDTSGNFDVFGLDGTNLFQQTGVDEIRMSDAPWSRTPVFSYRVGAAWSFAPSGDHPMGDGR